nr:autotransporter domain-containing protein [Bradyrhizobium sp. Ai1a-2]
MICGALFLAEAALPFTSGEANAQVAFTRIQAFGDSYADIGNLFRLTGGLGQLPLYPTGRFSGGTNYIDTTSALLGIPQNNHAVGGATSGAFNDTVPGAPGFTQQWQSFLASGQTFAPSDLVEMNIGGNDARDYYQGGGTLAGVPTAAATSAEQTMDGINAMVGAGARTIVFNVGDVSAAPEAAGNPNAPIGSAFSQTYNNLMQIALANVARSGVRVEFIDIGLLESLVKANPGRYVFANVGACTVACIGNPALQNQFLFYVDNLHLTSHGFAVLGEYIVNRLNAPLTIAPQGDIGQISAMGFASTLFGRLDLFRESYEYAVPAADAYAANARTPYTKARPLSLVGPWSFYMQGNGGVSDRQATVASDGFRLDSVGGTIGVEYRISANSFIGAAFDYSNPKAHLFNNAGTTEANSYQLGIYGGWADEHFFAQGLATIGHQDYRNARFGVVDTITSNPDGSTFVVGGKTGYLFDVESIQLGPIGGLTYARARVNGYTESGDPVLTLNVGRQTEEALIGSIGMQIRTPFTINRQIINPYLNLTAEDDFIGNGRMVQFGATSAPLIVNNWNIPNGASQDVYGRVTAGVVAPVLSNVSFTANVSRSFARQGGDDFFGTGGLKISF